MSGGFLRTSLILIAITGLAVALVAPAWRPDFLTLPGMYAAFPAAPAFPLRSLWLLIPVGILALALDANLRGALTSGRLAGVAILCSYLAILGFAYLQSDGDFALQRRIYRTSFAQDALLFESWSELWSEYGEQHTAMTARGRTHPPGAAALYWLTMRGGRGLAGVFGSGEDPDYESFVAEGYLGGYLWPLLQVLWLWPAWALGRRLYGERAAGIATCLGALAPSTVLIAPETDGLLPLFAMLAMYSLERGFAGGRLGWSALSGFIGAIGVTINWAHGALAPLFLAYFVLRRIQHAPARWIHLVALLSGGLVWTFGIRLLWGYWAFDGLSGGLGYHYDSAVNAVRPYGPFVLISPFVFFLWAGVPASAGFFLALRRSEPLAALREGARDPLVLASACAFFVLSLSGATRGETERLWLSFLPFVILAAGHGLAAAGENPPSRATRIGWVGLLGVTLMSAQLLGHWCRHHH